jgi:hypothetical protein
MCRQSRHRAANRRMAWVMRKTEVENKVSGCEGGFYIHSSHIPHRITIQGSRNNSRRIITRRNHSYFKVDDSQSAVYIQAFPPLANENCRDTKWSFAGFTLLSRYAAVLGADSRQSLKQSSLPGSVAHSGRDNARCPDIRNTSLTTLAKTNIETLHRASAGGDSI